MAGLLAAKVLAERYRDVLVVDRDPITGMSGSRRGVPQARHAHGLLARGQQILEEFFPGLRAGLMATGAHCGDLAGDVRWYFNGQRLRPARSGLLSLSATRAHLEEHVRSRVLALPGVSVSQQAVVRGLVADQAGTTITGVRVAGDDDEGNEHVVPADLVVDATGRGSRTPAWLAELGYQRPDEDKVKIDLAYTTRHFKLGSDPYGTDISINPVAWPGNPRGAFLVKLRDGVSMLSLTGMLGDHPPRDEQGFAEFVRTLDAPEIYRAICDAEPVDDAVSFRVPASIRLRYDRLRHFPDSLLVIGDGVCSFNPVYGQGMTVAAMEAKVLAEHMTAGSIRPLRFFREIKPVIDVPWETSVNGDLAFDGVAGSRSLKVRAGNAYVRRLHAAARHEPRFTEAFFRVAGLVDPPTALLRPGLAIGAFGAARKGAHSGQPLSEVEAAGPDSLAA